VLNYRIVDPFKAVTTVEDLPKSIEELAEVTLSSILRRLAFRDLSPSADEKADETDIEVKGK
jgi:regulator of protease activity HflC (stomatin/prohibitin superfamily)